MAGGHLTSAPECAFMGIMEVGMDATALLQGGVYVLRANGRVVYVGKARCMLNMIHAHRKGARRGVPAWSPIPPIVFDGVEVHPEHPDRVDALLARLTDELQPSWVPFQFPVPAVPQITRRL